MLVVPAPDHGDSLPDQGRETPTFENCLCSEKELKKGPSITTSTWLEVEYNVVIP